MPARCTRKRWRRLEFLVEDRRRLGLLLGTPGCGKSLVLEVFARRLRRGGLQVANVNLAGIELREFLWLLAAELGINPTATDDVLRLWRSVLDRLVENRYQQLNTVLLLDDSDRASPQVLEHLSRLAQLDEGAARLTIVLAATGFSTVRLPQKLVELAELRCDLEPWESADTIQHVTAALEQAGSKTPVFTDEALRSFTRFKHGRAAARQPLGQFGPACRRRTQTDANRCRHRRIGPS